MWKVAVFIIGLLHFCLIWLGPPSNQAKVRTQGYTLTSIGSDDNKQVERLMDFSSFHSAIRHDLHASPTIFFQRQKLWKCRCTETDTQTERENSKEKMNETIRSHDRQQQ
jgi:hypothetical protein